MANKDCPKLLPSDPPRKVIISADDAVPIHFNAEPKYAKTFKNKIQNLIIKKNIKSSFGWLNFHAFYTYGQVCQTFTWGRGGFRDTAGRFPPPGVHAR